MSDPAELHEHVLFVTLMPVVRLATNGEVSLRRLKQLLEVAYYQEMRRRGFKVTEVGKRLSVSTSKVALLSKQLKDHFSEPDREHELPRRIIRLLWAHPMSAARMEAALPDSDPRAIRQTLADLRDKGALEVMPGVTVDRYAITAASYRLVKDDLMARVAGLKNLLRSMVEVVEARFFRADPHAFARTANFHAHPEALQEIVKIYEEQLFPLICKIDDEAQANPEGTIPVDLSLLWATECPVEGLVAPAEPEGADSGEEETS